MSKLKHAAIHRRECGDFGRWQRGVNLLEVLIAFAVLSVGLLGVAALQIKGVQTAVGAYERSQATLIANDLVERIRANRGAVGAGQYAPYDTDGTVAGTAAANCASPPDEICVMEPGMDLAAVDDCDTSQMAIYDRFVAACGLPGSGGTRAGGVQDLLPGGRLVVRCLDAANAYAACAPGLRLEVMVSWTGREEDDTGQLADSQESVRLWVQP